jgi:hypothetical protein
VNTIAILLAVMALCVVITTYSIVVIAYSLSNVSKFMKKLEKERDVSVLQRIEEKVDRILRRLPDPGWGCKREMNFLEKKLICGVTTIDGQTIYCRRCRED